MIMILELYMVVYGMLSVYGMNCDEEKVNREKVCYRLIST